MIEEIDLKFIIVIILLAIIIIIMGFSIYVNMRELKNIDQNCLTTSDVKHFLPCKQNENLISFQPISNPEPKIKYTCQDLLDQYNQIVPYLLWNERYRTMVIHFLNQKDSEYNIKYLDTLNNHTLFLLTQFFCTPKNIYQGECLGFKISDLKNIPYNKWSGTNRIDAINDIYSIFAMDKNYLQKLNNKTLYDLIQISCSNY